MSENETGSAPSSTNVAQEQAPKRKKKKFVVIGVVAVVVIAAAVGFGIWHAQPSFCNAICHSPMDSYVEEYYSGDANQLITHHASAGKVCVDCHNPGLQTQISEAVSWVSGDFYDPLESRSSEFATREFCLTCHDDGDASTGEDWNDIVSATEDWGGSKDFNPHSSHLGNVDCGTCHSMHGQSQLECAACHSNSELPEGWTVRNAME